MEYLEKLIHLIREPGQLIVWGGYPGLALVIFVETGALFPFLPGDSLLVTAGLYAAKGDLDIAGISGLFWLNVILIPAAILGDATSYLIGAKAGPRLFSRPDARILKPEYLEQAQRFYEKHGGKAIVLARFVPIVRTFVPVVAGAARMSYRRFALFNFSGAILWVLSMTLVGFFLGRVIPNIDKHIEKVIVLVIFLSLVPGFVEYFRAKRQQSVENP